MLLASGLWALLLLPITIAPSHVFGIRLDALMALAMSLGGAYTLYKRSGQDFFKGRAKK
jgi:hypothetical protein